MRFAVAMIFRLVRDLDESFARSGIENAREAVRVNEHRARLVTAARAGAEKETTLLTSA